ncbi:Bifunctional transcriptional activator/DNA repair enzyme Ada [bacterium HR32]|jgi:O-6-methylguanine DNA methyltransferase|nr:Bifunctional transcriptional activator/DNA repair enzyme Ada [bacterium HR32]
MAATDRGVCRVYLGDRTRDLLRRLWREFPDARLHRDARRVGSWLRACLEGRTADIPVDLRATPFQQKVWQALRKIRPGQRRTYAEVARGLGRPGAARAVARACAANPVALLIPCHRVVRSDGGLGGYRWGSERKRALLEQEATASGKQPVR